MGLVLLLPARAEIANTDAIRNTYGEVGTLDMPSAHMAPDGQLAFTFGGLGRQQRYSLSFQALPWLEASFRYSHIVGRFSGYGLEHYYDRSFGLKLRLLKEGDIAPDVSVGIRDILGSGVLASEYIAASKMIGDFDLTAGMGWGKMSQTDALDNPLGVIASSFKAPREVIRTTGTLNIGQFFHGPTVGLFGSVAWQTPIEGLRLLAEYSSDKYAEYVFGNAMKVRSPVNLGVRYRPFESLALSAGWFYGSTYGVTVVLSGDPTQTFPSAVRIGGPEVPPPAVRTDAQQQSALQLLKSRTTSGRVFVEQRAGQDMLEALLATSSGVRDAELRGKDLVVDAHIRGDPATQCARYAHVAIASRGAFANVALTDLQRPDGAVYFCPVRSLKAKAGRPAAVLSADVERKIRADIEAQTLYFVALTASESELWLYFENYRYQNTTEAAGRIARILMADAPPSIEIFHIVTSYLGVPTTELTVARSDLERELLSTTPAVLEKYVRITAAPMDNPGLRRAVRENYPRFTWSIDPKLTQRVFDPDDPLQFLIYADLAAVLQLRPGLMLAADVTGTIWSNYTFTRPASSALPHVRSDVLQYLKHGKHGIRNLELVYRSRLTPEVFTELRGGYFEDMFMGVGGQLLWRPGDSRFAVGADLYQVWQRSYDRLFGLQKYGGKHYDVLTGHVSLYYRSPWYGLNYAIHAGRYLAGDYGATFEVTRRFESGIEIGAWATFTNVPFSKFGEGSFDKGIIVHIPFEWGLPIWSQSAYDLRLSSLTRDGGQRMLGDDSLYGATFGTSYGEYAEHFENFGEP